MEADYFKAAILDAIIPENTTAELAELLQDDEDVHDDTSNRLLPIKERDFLLFGKINFQLTEFCLLLISRSDEKLRALAVLQLPYCDEDTLKEYLSRLNLKVDVWAFDDSPSTDPNTALASPARELVTSVDGIQKSEPIVLASQSPDLGQILTLVWAVEILLARPRARVPHPVVVLNPSATVSSASHEDEGQNEDLSPGQLLETNVLEPMRFIPGLQNNPPYLAASRLQRVLPMPTSQRHRIHIGHVPPRRHKAVPATIARIRYNKFNTNSLSPTNIGLLDMEIIPFVQIDATVEEIDLSLKNGEVESLMPDFLPMKCQSGDCVTFMYKLHQSLNVLPNPALGSMNPNIDLLSIKILLHVQFSSKCRPVVMMEWTTHVDFTQALNPSYGPPSQPIQRPNRPTSLPVINGNGSSAPVVSIATSLQPVYDLLARSGLSISFSASNEPVEIGKPFTWKVLVVNQSPKVARIAIIPLPRIQRQTSQAQTLAKRHAPKSSTASFHPSERRHTKNGEDIDVGQAIVEENVLYVMQHSGAVPPEADILALTAELRIGPLAPEQCHESEIQMIAFQVGTLQVDVMRVVDLVKEAEDGVGAPGVVADIRDLPDVVAVKSTDDAG